VSQCWEKAVLLVDLSYTHHFLLTIVTQENSKIKKQIDSSGRQAR